MFEDRKRELHQEALKVKLRHSDKVFQLSAELDQDILEINKKLKELEELEKKDGKVKNEAVSNRNK